MKPVKHRILKAELDAQRAQEKAELDARLECERLAHAEHMRRMELEASAHSTSDLQLELTQQNNLKPVFGQLWMHDLRHRSLWL